LIHFYKRNLPNFRLSKDFSKLSRYKANQDV